VIFDADILIWYLRRAPAAIRLVDETPSREIAVVSYMEVVRGVRDKKEFRELKSFLAEFDFRMLPLSESIGHRAVAYMEEFSLKIDLSVPDALLAATAVECGIHLATGNTKHFPPMDGLDIRPFRPT
jgi:predicted nucleic acid-binding protein